MKKSEEDQLKRELGEIWPQLKAHAVKFVRANCRAKKSRPAGAATMYAKRAFDMLGKPEGQDSFSYTNELKAKVEELVAADESKNHRREEDTDWTKVVLVTIATLRRQYGQQILDKDISDWVQDAVIQFFDRTRRFPHDAEKPVGMSTWLYQTVRSNISHARRDAQKKPQHLRIVTHRKSEESRGECSEEHLPAVHDDPPDDEDDDDADYDRRRPARPVFDTTGVRPNARVLPSPAR